MKTVIKDEINKEQVKLNLAINYMVIERVLRCMGIYNTVCDVYEELDGIFVNARNRSLLNNLVNLGKEGVEIYLEKYQQLFGLSYAVLLGQEQIKLGIVVDEIDFGDDYEYDYTGLRNFDVEELRDIIKEEGSEIQILDFGGEDNDADAYNKYKSMLNNSLDKSIGNIIFDEITDNKDILKQLQFNPFGINTLGLFAELLLDKKINLNDESLQEEKEYSDKLDKCFNDAFNNINISTWKRNEVKKESKQENSVNWKDNIYSLDSIIYSILRYLHKDGIDIIGGELGSTKYQILDIEGEALPYPLKFVDKIIYPIKFDKYTFCELFKESDLLSLMGSLLCNEYRIADRKLELITQSSIEKEIKRYKEKIKNIENRDNIEIDDGNELSNKTIEYLEHIKNLAILEDQKKLFETDKKQWVEHHSIELANEQKLLDIVRKYKEAKQNQAKAVKEKDEAYKMRDEAYSRGNEKDIIKSEQVFIKADKELEKAEKVFRKAETELEKIKPFILVKEPYYEEVGLADYGVRGTCNTATKKKGTKKNSKKQSKKTKETK